MKRFCLLGLLLCLFCMRGIAQKFDLSQKVSFRYVATPLAEVLSDMSENYSISFSYSKDVVSLDQEINYRVRNKKLSKALKEMFDKVNILYMPIGDQLVLKKGKIKLNKSPKKKRKKEKYNPPIESAPKESDLSKQKEEIIIPDRLLLEKYDFKKLEASNYYHDLVDKGVCVLPPERKLTSYNETKLAQVSVIPRIGTNRAESERTVNNVSFNLFVGNNGGVDGVEIGGFVNIVKEDVKGVQIAGLVNMVGGDVRNSEWIADKEDIKKGIQIAGIINMAQNVKAYQAAGILNVVRANFEGVQIGGIGNVVGADAVGLQVAGIFNHNEGYAGSQLSGITNVAAEVDGFQVSGIYNKADYVRQFQIGLINVCDSIGGTPIGLMSFVKGGENNYNRFEVSSSEMMHVNFGMKFGVKSFYNMMHAGMRFKNGVQGWGLGYGVGFMKSWTKERI